MEWRIRHWFLTLHGSEGKKENKKKPKQGLFGPLATAEVTQDMIRDIKFNLMRHKSITCRGQEGIHFSCTALHEWIGHMNHVGWGGGCLPLRTQGHCPLPEAVHQTWWTNSLIWGGKSFFAKGKTDTSVKNSVIRHSTESASSKSGSPDCD